MIQKTLAEWRNKFIQNGPRIHLNFKQMLLQITLKLLPERSEFLVNVNLEKVTESPGSKSSC